MTVQFKPAKRENVPLLIGLEGASGSGKTYSALLLAAGIAEEIGRANGRPGRIYGLDTEHKRMLHYADDFTFMHADLDPPFRPKTYGEAIRAAEANGADVIVIDSFSHEWEGEGGVKDWAQEILDKNDKMKPPAQWNIPKAGPEGHKRLVNQMLAARAHIIVCLRSEEKLRMEEIVETNADGSTKMWNGKPSKRTVITAAKDLPVEERWQPICEKRFPYEITTSLLLLPSQPGVPVARKLQEQHRAFFPRDRRIDKAAGAGLARWAMGGVADPSPPKQVGDSGEDINATVERLYSAAEHGTDALRQAWAAKATGPHRDTLETNGALADMKAMAARNDPRESTDERPSEPAGGYDGA